MKKRKVDVALMRSTGANNQGRFPQKYYLQRTARYPTRPTKKTLATDCVDAMITDPITLGIGWWYYGPNNLGQHIIMVYVVGVARIFQ